MTLRRRVHFIFGGGEGDESGESVGSDASVEGEGASEVVVAGWDGFAIGSFWW